VTKDYPHRQRRRSVRGRSTPPSSKRRATGTATATTGSDSNDSSTHEQRLAARASSGPHLLAWVAATRQTFTICRPDGYTVAHDRFHRDLLIDSDDAAIEAAALQAIWLAAHGKDLWGADVGILRIVTSRFVADPGALHRAAFTSGLVLDLVTDTATRPAISSASGRLAPRGPHLPHPTPEESPMKSRSIATLLTVTAGTCLLAACTEHPSRGRPPDRYVCARDRFEPPFTAVDPCSAESVTSAALETMFTYRPAEGLDPRRAFEAATPLLEPEFARSGAPAATALAPVTPDMWGHWRDQHITVTASARATADDHPADTAARAARVVTVSMQPSDGTPPLRLVVFAVAHYTQTDEGVRWLLSNVQVAS